MSSTKLPAGPQLRGLRTISWLFDELVRVPGTNLRFGLDALIGLIPGAGDVAGGAVSLYALAVAARLGAPTPVIMRMALNVIVDALIGAIPFLGDLFDASWKANRKNVELLERYMGAPTQARRSSLVVVAATAVVLAAALVGIAVGSIWLIRQVIALF